MKPWIVGPQAAEHETFVTPTLAYVASAFASSIASLSGLAFVVAVLDEKLPVFSYPLPVLLQLAGKKRDELQARLLNQGPRALSDNRSDESERLAARCRFDQSEQR